MSDYTHHHAMQELQAAQGRENRNQATKEFEEACELAAEVGMELVRHTESHYQLKWDGWLLNIYPGNGRLYADTNRGAPYLNFRGRDWTLVDVVKEARKHRRNLDGKE